MPNVPGLRITDGTTTVTLSDGSTGWLLQYEAKNKLASEPEVTEQCTILLLGGISAVRSTIESINRLFQGAQTWQKEKLGARVFVERLTESAGAWWRSEIIEALPVPEPSAMDWGVVQGKIEITLVFTRKNWWEGAEVSVPLTNGNGTNNTSGLTVYNHDDSGTGHDNWVSIAAADVAGDLPAPCRVLVKNTYATLPIETIWIGHNWIDPDNFTSWLEIENGNVVGTDNSEATCSGGYYTSFTGSFGSETKLCSWAISGTNIIAMANQYFRPLIRYRLASNSGAIVDGSISAIYLRFKVSQASSVLFTSNWAYATGECSTVIIPTYKAKNTLLEAYNLELWAKAIDATPIGFELDYVHLQPLNSWRKIVMPDNALLQNYYLVDDSIDDLTYYYYLAPAELRSQILGLYGTPIYLQPNAKQRLYFLWQSSADSDPAEIAATATVMLSYRPRKLTLN